MTIKNKPKISAHVLWLYGWVYAALAARCSSHYPYTELHIMLWLFRHRNLLFLNNF